MCHQDKDVSSMILASYSQHYAAFPHFGHQNHRRNRSLLRPWTKVQERRKLHLESPELAMEAWANRWENQGIKWVILLQAIYLIVNAGKYSKNG